MGGGLSCVVVVRYFVILWLLRRLLLVELIFVSGCFSCYIVLIFLFVCAVDLSLILHLPVYFNLREFYFYPDVSSGMFSLKKF